MNAFEVSYTDIAELRRAWERELSYGGSFVPTESPPAAFAKVTVRLRLPDRLDVSLAGSAVNIQPRGFFVQFIDAVERDVLGLAMVPLLEAAPEPEPEPEPEPDSTLEGDTDPDPAGRREPLGGLIRNAWEMIDPASTVPLHKQIAELKTSERIRLARVASRPVRNLLIRDPEKRIHAEVVKNKKVTDEELVDWSGLAGISPLALRWIGTQKHLLRNPRIRLNLVKNPMTPQSLSLSLIGQLPQNELLKIARSKRVREVIARAARKKLMDSGVV